jgi:sarcosine oxidase
MPERYDTIVLGLGAMGSAACYQLAKKGARVLGIDRYDPPHAHGSSHGDSRITRQALGEGDYYVPLVMRANELWREIEKETGAELLVTTGALVLTHGDDNLQTPNHQAGFYATTVAAATKYGLEHELLDAAAVRQRYPQFNVSDDDTAYYEPGGGYLRAEASISAQLELARKYGAELHTNEPVVSFDDKDGVVTVKTEQGTYQADKLILSAGPWIGQFLPEYADRFSVRRQIMYWFDIEGPIDPFLPANCPVYLWRLLDLEFSTYGFPAIDGPDGGIKIACHKFTPTADPDDPAQPVTQADITEMYETYVKPFINHAAPTALRTMTCMYTVAPQHEFIIDFLPDHANILVASPCSGHGFKHSSAIGEVLADMASGKKSPLDLSHFTFNR